MFGSFLNLLGYFLPVLIVLTILVHGLFAAAVFLDACEFEAQGKQLYFVGPLVWCLAALFLGLIGVYVYWVMHHSNLRRPIDPT